MAEKEITISTRQAAQLLTVHESSIKRWCNAGTIACRYTSGGHRRIPLTALLDFAREEDLSCALLSFAPDEHRLWEGLEQARRKKDFSRLVDLLYDWLKAHRRTVFTPLLALFQAQGFVLARLFDQVVSPVVHRIGDAWHTGALSIGDEHRMTALVQEGLMLFRLQHLPQATGTNGRHKVALVGSTRGAAHSLGAAMVQIVLEAAGWEVVYFGSDMPAEDYALQQQHHAAKLVCVSLIPPHGQADARHLVRLLSHLYDPAQPYSLVFGGPAVEAAPLVEQVTLPFQSVQAFRNLEAFRAWLPAAPVNDVEA